MNKENIKILDFYVHGGHQYEFMKIGYKFYLAGLDHKKPDWSTSNRPTPANLETISQNEIYKHNFDVVIIRSPVPFRVYEPIIKKGAIPVAVVQTTDAYPALTKAKVIVWNCHETMKRNQNIFSDKINIHIVHGFDPEEFLDYGSERNGRVLTVANAFKKRSQIMGFDLWSQIKNEVKICDLIGDKNKDIGPNIMATKNMNELIGHYNRYSILLSTTLSSAMPRSRSEGAMCGMPVVSTNNYGISRYFTHKKDMMLCQSKSEMVNEIKYLLNNPNFRIEMGQAARETAIKHFHIKDYIRKWKDIIEML